ncbi:hypothetical protein LCGC14_1368380 [marine sediment metagenome]|uniref:Uncharacterized protein n=1 Tax=marine sediment metagenome TaxID=412755 RepID=A0A0F9K6G6_9ZZZZ
MIQIRDNQWVMADKIESAHIEDGNLVLVVTQNRPQLVDDKYLGDVCGALQLSQAAIQATIIREKTDET